MPKQPIPSSARSPAPTRARDLGLLLGILATAMVLRLYRLGVNPFEQDELYTFLEARDLFHTSIKPGIQARPLYYLIQHGLLGLLPYSEFNARILPLLLGILGVWVTYLLGREAWGARGGRLAALMAAVSPWHVYVSGMARYWSLAYLMVATSCWLLLRAYGEDSPRWYLAALVALLVGAATHPTVMFPLVGVTLGLVLVRNGGELGWTWPSRRAWTWLWVPFALLLIMAYLALRITGSSGALRNWQGREATANLRLAPAMIQWMTPTVFAAAVVGVLLGWTSGGAPNSRRWAMMAGCGGLVGLGLLLLASRTTDVYADYGIGLLALALASTGGVASWLPEIGGARRGHGVAIGFIMLAGILPSTVSHLIDGTRFDYRPAFERARMVDPSRALLAWPIIVQRRYAKDLRGLELRPDAAYLDSTLAREGKLWAVISTARYGMVNDSGGAVARFLHRRCSLEESFGRPRLDYREYRVSLYDCRSAGGAPQLLHDGDSIRSP